MSLLSKAVKKAAPTVTTALKIAAAPVTIATASTAKAVGIGGRGVDKALGFNAKESALIEKYGKPAAQVGLGVATGAFLASGGLAATAAGGAVSPSGVAGASLFSKLGGLLGLAKNYLPVAAALANESGAPAPADTNQATAADGVKPSVLDLGWGSFLPTPSEPAAPKELVTTVTGQSQPLATQPVVVNAGGGASSAPPAWLWAVIAAVAGWILTNGGKHHFRI